VEARLVGYEDGSGEDWLDLRSCEWAQHFIDQRKEDVKSDRSERTSHENSDSIGRFLFMAYNFNEWFNQT
jgi:hypothetical protein